MGQSSKGVMAKAGSGRSSVEEGELIDDDLDQVFRELAHDAAHVQMQPTRLKALCGVLYGAALGMWPAERDMPVLGRDRWQSVPIITLCHLNSGGLPMAASRRTRPPAHRGSSVSRPRLLSCWPRAGLSACTRALTVQVCIQGQSRSAGGDTSGPLLNHWAFGSLEDLQESARWHLSHSCGP